MKIFLTGGHGFIGSRVVERLIEGGHDVRCLVRASSKTHRIDHLEWERHVGDVRDRASLEAGMQGADAVIHLASVSSWSDMRSSVLEDVVQTGTENVVEAAKASGVKRVVFVSSSMAVNATPTPIVFDETSPFELTDPKYRYPLAKHRAEKRALEVAGDDVELVIVNPAEVYGPNDDAMVTAGNLRDALNDWPALACTGGSAITHVDDVADGMVRALEKGRHGERYILGGDNLHVEELIRLTLEIAGQKKPVMKLPNGMLKVAIGALDKLGLPTPVEPEVVTYATLYWFMDSTKAKNELGYAPRPAREVLEPTIAWLYDNGHIKTPRATDPATASS